MSFTLNPYTYPSQVDAYAQRHGKSFWLVLSEQEKRSFIEKATRQIVSYHGQGPGFFNQATQQAAILQSLYRAEYSDPITAGETAAMASDGSYSDSVHSISNGKEPGWDSLAKGILDEALGLESGIVEFRRG